MPTDAPLGSCGDGGPLTFGGPLAPVLELWAGPVRPLLPVVGPALRKPLAEVTMTELLACLMTFGYVFASAALAGTMAGNLARVAIRGR